MDEKDLIEKLRSIQALYHRAATPGERDAAGRAYERVRSRLDQEIKQRPVEYKFSFESPYTRQLFVALARKHGLTPYRRYRQRHSTVMLRVSQRVLDEGLWPEYTALRETLDAYLDEVTERVIRESVHADLSDAPETAETAEIEGG